MSRCEIRGRSAAIFEPPNFIVGFGDVPMMGQSAEHVGGYFGIGKYLLPVGDG